MKKKICILTATRAEYGLLRPIIKGLMGIEEFDIRIAVTGAHLSHHYGNTYLEIENDGFIIDKKIEILDDSDTPVSISKAMGLAMIGFSDYFATLNPDVLLVLGDRYETLAVAMVAVNQSIPVVHLYGGEITEGALDDSIRHAITKLSYLHFTSTEEYRLRVIQLGEEPERVFCVGGIGVEIIKNETLMTKKALESSLNFDVNKPFALVTFHPVTLELNEAIDQTKNLLEALKKQSQLNYIITKSNADAMGLSINRLLESFVQMNDNAIIFASLGQNRYLSAMKYATMVIGNSSSGIIETPSFGVPTINVGSRQKGRLQGDNVINCAPLSAEIIRAMNLALTQDFRAIADKALNPYGDGHTSLKIIEIMTEFLLQDKLKIKKKFYDVR